MRSPYRYWDSRTKHIVTMVMFVVLLFVVPSCAPESGPDTPIPESPYPDDSLSHMQDEQAVSTKPPATPSPVIESTTPSAEGSTQSACPEVEGRIERVEYSSHLVGKYVPVLVYLPPCYSEEREYPALYLLHGKPQDEYHWLILGMDKVINQQIVAGEMGGLIVVMPEQPEPLFSQTDGGPGSYEGEFLSTLIPFIEASYSVSSRNDQRAVAGISRGGVWALEIAFLNPERFAGVAALSPALNVNDAREEFDPLIIAQSAKAFSERIFLASGDVDSAATETKRLHDILVERGVPHRYTTVPGGHEGATWEQLLDEMLDYLVQGW
ncbi:MAG: alpha/beta hydrolase-fold protein [Anaerolineales bacterium]